MPTWKIAQSNKNTAKKIKLAVAVLGLVIVLLLFAQALKFTQMLFGKQSNWNGDSNINVVLKSDSLKLLSYNPKDEKVTVVEIPEKLYLEVPGGYGSWRVGSVFALGGGGLPSEAISSFFGIPLAGFLDNATLASLTDKNPLSNFSILSQFKTNLTPFEVLRLKMGISAVRFDKITTLNLEEMGLLDGSKLADGTEVLTSDPVRLDSLSERFADPEIKTERKTIAVFNATSHSGIAQKAARLIANIGGDVIIISNSEIKIEKTAILGEASKTLDNLKQIFSSSGTIDPQLEDLASPRAQINLFLGEDYFNSL